PTTENGGAMATTYAVVVTKNTRPKPGAVLTSHSDGRTGTRLVVRATAQGRRSWEDKCRYAAIDVPTAAGVGPSATFPAMSRARAVTAARSIASDTLSGAARRGRGNDGFAGAAA